MIAADKRRRRAVPLMFPTILFFIFATVLVAPRWA
jgi:hypothetical protein